MGNHAEGHAMKRSRRLRFAITVLGVALIGVTAGGADASAQDAATCRDNYDRIMEGAQAEWPMSGPFEIPGEWVRYFMAAYNAEVESADRVVADRVVVFPMDPADSATWWYFGFAENCLTFYAELGESKGYHMIEQGFAMLNPEQQLE